MKIKSNCLYKWKFTCKVVMENVSVAFSNFVHLAAQPFFILSKQNTKKKSERKWEGDENDDRKKKKEKKGRIPK